MKEGDIGICSGCGELSEAIECCEETGDWQHGRPAIQRRYFTGSSCCGEPMDEKEDYDDL